MGLLRRHLLHLGGAALAATDAGIKEIE